MISLIIIDTIFKKLHCSELSFRDKLWEHISEKYCNAANKSIMLLIKVYVINKNSYIFNTMLILDIKKNIISYEKYLHNSYFIITLYFYGSKQFEVSPGPIEVLHIDLFRTNTPLFCLLSNYHLSSTMILFTFRIRYCKRHFPPINYPYFTSSTLIHISDIYLLVYYTSSNEARSEYLSPQGIFQGIQCFEMKLHCG